MMDVFANKSGGIIHLENIGCDCDNFNFLKNT